MYNYQKNDEAMKQHLAKVNRNSLLVFGKNKEIINTFLEFYQLDGSYPSVKKKLQKLLWVQDTEKLSSIFSNSQYKVLVSLLGKNWAQKFKIIWDNSSNFTYSEGYDRRSFRSKTDETLYLSNAINKLNAMFHLVSDDFTYEKYFSSTYGRYEALNLVIPDLIAVEADENNLEIMGRIKEIFLAENNVGFVTREIIKGLLMSKNEKAHKLVGDLLLAAKLQEGLRQTIVECMDEGSKEGFLYILHLILEHNLIRFSSVVRALDVWTGLGIAAEKTSVVKKCLETAYQCLTTPGYKEECLQSNDAMLLYMGLWSIAFDDIGSIHDRLRELMVSTEKYKKLTALYFLSQSKYPTFQHRMAVPMLDDLDFEVKSWALKNLYTDVSLHNIRYGYHADIEKYEREEGAIPPEKLFTTLKNIVERMPKKELRFKESVFPWCETAISCDEILGKMMITLVNDPSDHKMDFLLDYKEKMNVHTRTEFVDTLFKEPKTPKQRQALFELMGDKGQYVREAAMRRVMKLTLEPEDYHKLEALLKYKAGDLRKNAISMLLKQEPEQLLGSIKRLMDDKDENKQLAALDIIAAIEKDPIYQSIMEECMERVQLLTITSESAKILAEKITKTESDNKSLKDGLGLFDPGKEIAIREMPAPDGFSTKKVLTSSLEEVKKVLQAFSDIVDKYKDYEYDIETWNSGKEKVVLGARYGLSRIPISYNRNVLITLDDYPLPEVWREAAKEHHLSTEKLLEIKFYFQLGRPPHLKRKAWFQRFIEEHFPIRHEEFFQFTEALPYHYHIQTIFHALLNECPQEEVYERCKDMTLYLYHQIPRERFAEEYVERELDERYGRYWHRDYVATANELSYWYLNLVRLGRKENYFKEFFSLGYTLYKASGYQSHMCLQLADFEKAYSLGMVDENELTKELCARPLSMDNLRNLNKTENSNYKDLITSEKLHAVYNKVVEKIIPIELKRGDMTTEVSHLVSSVYRIEGTRYFVDVLAAMGKETYVRGYVFVGDDSTKKNMFSHILKHCYPAKGEDDTTLKEFLKTKKVTDNQLVDAAMYAPQWLDIIEKYLGWPGLKSAGWYFHAHINEHFSKDKETMVARYTPISPEDLKLGAFDIHWFKEAYSQMGEKRFKVVYNSAKYIAGGGLHKRSQLFTDATLGKLPFEQAETRVKEKRNKDYLLCYGLIPLREGQKREDLLHRYEFIQTFLKESKQFGAQRRASEAKVVSIAMENLARNAGFSDTNRFIWNMEIEKINSIQSFLVPETVGESEIHININELGKPEIIVTKAGKTLKSIPAKLKKDPYVNDLKLVHKSLKEQYSRARSMLEKAMEGEERFTASELGALSKHPIIYPLIKSLVFKSRDSLGYFENGGLVGADGQSIILGAEDECIIAHPVHLYESGQWSAFQEDIFTREVVQPFKQVFRELYTPTTDELESGTISRRYEGHQVQPKKAAALLKSRGWTVSYEEGLQKVYYKENIIAQIVALADWFSPADVEAPTLEWIQFTHRKTGAAIAFTDLPQVIFSEVMRDIDLVVSVAHVGGVDPEASLSTVEMRTAIIGETVRLLKLTNVELKGSHGLIKGTLGDYSVHLGSGVVHKMARGALNILPVHSQHRGRIFLPFIDEDPKTAEITSKIVMLAEDKKIKDPTVLVQISG